MDKKAVMCRDEIEQILPHRPPMLLVDTVEEMIPGKMIRTSLYIDPTWDIFRGHFPGMPVLPGVYTVEYMAQSSNIMMMCLDRYAGRMPLLLGIDKVRFLKKIVPGSTIEAHSELAVERTDKAIVTCHAEVLLDGVQAAIGDVTLAMR